jgi:hypothetical protein
VAIGVAPAQSITTIEAEADEVVCLYAPTDFYAVGQFFDDFSEVTDEMVVTALSAGRNGDPGPACCCLPLFVVPMIVLVYAIYDAYNAAEKINNKPVREWP